MIYKSNWKSWINNFLSALGLAMIWLAVPLVHGQTPGVNFTMLAAFNATNGANPYDPPVLGPDGNLYGTLPFVGSNTLGVIFQVTTNGSETIFYDFGSWDGALPLGPLVSGQDNNLYGAAAEGGTNGDGTIFEITTNANFTLLYSFGMITNALGYALDGKDPYSVVQGQDGNFYGLTYFGGTSNLGTVFQFLTNGTLNTLHSFTGDGSTDDGAHPYSGALVQGPDGAFYGTTSAGGTNNDGTIFRVTTNGTLTTLFEFNGTDGSTPYAGLNFGSDGNLYGTTVEGGANGYGTAFQITTNGVLTMLFQFGGSDGLAYPEGGLVPGNNNTLFGTTYEGGSAGEGSIFQLTTNGLLTTLHNFTYTNDGAYLNAGVIRDPNNGALFGTAHYGGTNGGYGTVYSLRFAMLLSIISPAANGLLTNNALAINGTASDNAPGSSVTNVLYSINGAAWTNAMTQNGWINWTAGGSLGPGTNTVAAYAADSSGNDSPTDTVHVVYVAALTVNTNGVGSLSTNYNGMLLTVGASYSITATAGSGFVFTNWTGGTNLPLAVLTNKSTIQFVMEPNLMLQANFLDSSKPTLSITNLTSGQHVSNAVFTVGGKAADNWQVTNVFYSLNGTGWSNALTSNNWTNWSAVVTLTPGTNTIAAYAVDPVGDASPTNTVAFQFVVTNQLQVLTTGLGTISPNYGNAWLNTGQNYSMTATAGTGFAFTNWTGGTSLPLQWLTNGSTVSFQMQTNLILQANFGETSKPTVNITNLISGQLLSNATFTVRGTASDTWAVSNVWCQINGQGWNMATNINNWTNWSAGVMLQPGTNTVQVYAMNLGGNVSTTNNVSFQYVVNTPLTVEMTGLGTISPNYSNAVLNVGQNYSMTASARTGFMFTNWYGGTSLPLQWLTNGTTVLFKMQTNLILQANFVETTKPTVTITAPTAGQHMTNALANMVGTTTDNWGISNVWYLLNSNAWNTVNTTNSYTNWTKTVALLAGTNTLKVYAMNLGGNYSTTNSLSVVSSNAFELQLAFATGQPLASNGLNFILQVSTNLNGHILISTNLANWTILTNFVGSNTVISIHDPAATNYNQRFYRAVVP